MVLDNHFTLGGAVVPLLFFVNPFDLVLYSSSFDLMRLSCVMFLSVLSTSVYVMS